MSGGSLHNRDEVVVAVAAALASLDGAHADTDVDAIARRAVTLATGPASRDRRPPSDFHGRHGIELLPVDGRCLYDDERAVIGRLAAGERTLTDRHAETVMYALDRLGVLRFRRLEQL